FFFFLYVSTPLLYLHSFPTRRSSDLLLLLIWATTMKRTALFPAIPIFVAHAVDWCEILYFPKENDALQFPTRGKYNASFSLGKRSEEHTSELQSLAYLVCRLLLEKKK